MQRAGGMDPHELDEIAYLLLGQISCRWCTSHESPECARGHYPDYYSSARDRYRIKRGDTRSRVARVIASTKRQKPEPSDHWVNPGL